jgi:arginyl-tRNA synthetase
MYAQFGTIAAGFEKYGNEEELEKDSIMHPCNIYVQVLKGAEADAAVKTAATVRAHRNRRDRPARKLPQVTRV